MRYCSIILLIFLTNCTSLGMQDRTTVNIQDGWPMIGIGSLDRSTEFGKACQMPDGRWRIINRVM